MTRSLKTLMAKEPGATAERVIQMLDECVQLEGDGTATRTPLVRRSARGRRPRAKVDHNCSAASGVGRCTTAFETDFKGEVEDLEAVKKRQGVKKRERLDLQVAIQQRNWAPPVTRPPCASKKKTMSESRLDCGSQAYR